MALVEAASVKVAVESTFKGQWWHMSYVSPVTTIEPLIRLCSPAVHKSHHKVAATDAVSAGLWENTASHWYIKNDHHYYIKANNGMSEDNTCRAWPTAALM